MIKVRDPKFNACIIAHPELRQCFNDLGEKFKCNANAKCGQYSVIFGEYRQCVSASLEACSGDLPSFVDNILALVANETHALDENRFNYDGFANEFFVSDFFNHQ